MAYAIAFCCSAHGATAITMSFVSSSTSVSASNSSYATTTATSPFLQTQPPDGALIFLHGLGDTPSGWEMTIQQQLPQIKPRLSNLAYVFPPAPTMPISISGGGTLDVWFVPFLFLSLISLPLLVFSPLFCITIGSGGW
jgi:Phospholipase/Carboxylesterase